MKWLYYVASPWYSQLHTVFCSLMSVIRSHQMSYTHGWFGSFWVLHVGDCAVMYSFWIKSNTNLLVIVAAKCQRVQNYTRLYQRQNHWESPQERDEIEWHIQQNFTVLLVDTTIGSRKQLAKKGRLNITSSVTFRYTFDRELPQPRFY